MKKDLKAFAKEITMAGFPFMEGREKEDLKSIYDKVININEFGFMKDPDNNKEYLVFLIKEDDKVFFFGGQVLTDNFKEFEKEGYADEIRSNGIPALLSAKTSKKSGRSYTAVEYYPEVK